MTDIQLEDIKPLALEFAKSIAGNNPDISSEILIEKSVKLAINWLNNEDLISRVYSIHFPNWIDLENLDDAQKKEVFNINKKCWVAGIDNMTREFVITKASYRPTSNTSSEKNLYLTEEGYLIKGLYIIAADENDPYDFKNKPIPPKQLKSAFFAQNQDRSRKSIRSY